MEASAFVDDLAATSVSRAGIIIEFVVVDDSLDVAINEEEVLFFGVVLYLRKQIKAVLWCACLSGLEFTFFDGSLSERPEFFWVLASDPLLESLGFWNVGVNKQVGSFVSWVEGLSSKVRDSSTFNCKHLALLDGNRGGSDVSPKS